MPIFRAALDAADAEKAVLRHLKFDGKTLTAGRARYPLSRFDRIQAIGAGKAGARMAHAVERVLGRRLDGGWVNVPDGATARLRRIHLNACGHPIPDQRGVDGSRRIAGIAARAGPRDLLLCLISGGASALMPAPSSPLTLEGKQRITGSLLKAGANIHELNTVRKHLSDLKGGRLAELAYPATVIAIILSDVIGDNLDVIGSGPTVGDSTSAEDAIRVLKRYAIDVPPGLRETPKPGAGALSRVRNVIVGSNRLAIDAAARRALDLGYHPLVLSTFVEGETRDVALVHAAVVKEVLNSNRPVRRPACILSGGETTVTVRGKGKGGRNQEFVLAAIKALDGCGPVTVFSAGTDGIDGPTDAAGAVADSRTLSRACELGLDAGAYLAANDSYHFFERVGGLVMTGPTGTNVMDVRFLLV